MPLSSAHSDDDYFFDDRNTARQTRGNYSFQDHCLVIRCIDNLVSGGLHRVVAEWSSDYLAVSADGVVELVSIKHRRPDQPFWTPSELWSPVADLYSYWVAMGRTCDCAFVSNLAVPAKTMETLAGTWSRKSGLPAAETDAFVRNVLLVNAQVMPHQPHIRAVAVDRMRRALIDLDRDPQYAEQCYRAIHRRVVAVSTEEPESPERKGRRLAGLMRSLRSAVGPRSPTTR